MQTILVTGGAGYIGSHVIVALQQNTDYNVVSIDNFYNSLPDTYGKISKITGKEIISYAIDITNYEDVESVFELHPDIVGVIHLAAFKSVPESIEQPLKYYRNNVGGFVNVLQAAQKHKVESFVFSSSCSVYGYNTGAAVSEYHSRLRPISTYAKTKALCEEILIESRPSDSGMKAVSLRYFNPAGAHESCLIGDLSKERNLVSAICHSAKTGDPLLIYGADYPTKDGTGVRDYIHVMDVAEAHVSALMFLATSITPPYSEFNIGTGSGLSVREAVSAFTAATETTISISTMPRRPGDVASLYANASKAKQILGWEAKRSVKDMMLSAWNFAKNN